MPRKRLPLSTKMRRKLALEESTCMICPFNRYLEVCHIIPKRLGGGDTPLNVFILCPNHHKLFDWGLLNEEEVLKIEPYLLALCEVYSYNLVALEYLYFQLGMRDNPPKWMESKRMEMMEKISNRY